MAGAKQKHRRFFGIDFLAKARPMGRKERNNGFPKP
jgi:hypothetical protein